MAETTLALAAAEARPVDVVIVGAGAMGQAWMRTVLASPHARLVGVADMVEGLAESAVGAVLEAADGRNRVRMGTDGVELARSTGAEAIIDVTIPAAHFAVTSAALSAGLPVLGEKPCAGTLAEAISLAGCSEATGELFMVSQSRRYNPHLREARRLADSLGGAGIVDTRFYRAPRFGGFREEMHHPLLVDMAIHAFDAGRTLLPGIPSQVRAISSNPSWSWYAGDAAATVHVSYDSGAVHTFSGSWCAPGQETSWNGDWSLSCPHGSVQWDGERSPTACMADGVRLDGRAPADDERWELAGALAEFCAALRGGPVPEGEVHQNIWTQAIVDASVRSAETDRSVEVAALLEEARAEALDLPAPPGVREALLSWGSALSGLRTG
jgi:predicted dehydrogenase